MDDKKNQVKTRTEEDMEKCGKTENEKDIRNRARSLAEAVYLHAVSTPDRIAAADKSGPHSYAELWDDISLAAGVLKDLGVKKGSRLVMECSQDVLFLTVNLACQLLEAIFVGVERKVARGRLDEIVRQTEPVLMLMIKKDEASADGVCSMTIREFCALLNEKREAESRPEPESDTRCPKEEAAFGLAGKERLYLAAQAVRNLKGDAVSEIIFSTGTTGKTKGAILTSSANIANAQNVIDGVHMGPEAVELVPLPINHAHGLRTCYAHLLNGSCVLIVNGISFPRVVFDTMLKYGANALDLSPSAAQMLINTSAARLKEIASTIDYVEVGAAFLPESTKQKLRECFPASRLYNFYGSSESGRACCLDFSKAENLPGCIGLPVPNATFVVMGPDDTPIQSDAEHTGRLASAGPMNMSGYWRAPELSKETLKDGYVLTADLSYIDERGYIYVLGRQDDVIVYKGIKISPEEIEEAAAGCELVADCACVPQEDEVAGQVPKLFVVAKDRETFRQMDLFDYLKKHIDDNRMPRTIELIDAIPRTYNGKLLRKELAAKAQTE